MIAIRRNLVCLLLTLCAGFSYGQSDYGDHWSFSYSYGSLITHREAIDNSLRSLHPQGIHLSYAQRSKGTEQWHDHWSSAHTGYSFSYINLRDRDVLGSVIGVSMFFEKHLDLGSPIVHLSYRIAPGVSYSPKVYDAQDNPLNLFVSSPVNISFEANFLFHIHISDSWSFHLGPQLNHYSNAAMQFPNIGINVPSLKIGMNYLVGTREAYKPGSENVFTALNQVQLRLALSLNSAGEEYDQLDLAYLIAIQNTWRLHPRISLIASLDFIRSNASKKILENENANPYRLGLAPGIQFELGKLSFCLQYGYYLYRPEKELYKSSYSRFGFKFQLNDRITLSSTLRSHVVKAELLEWGIAYDLF